MRKAFTGLAILLLLVVVAQFYFAGTGSFSTATREEYFRPHHALGYVIFVLPVVMVLAGAIGRVPKRLIGLSASVAGLTAVQVGIGALARSFDDIQAVGPLTFGMHAINGLAILGVSVLIVMQATRRAA